MVNKALNSSFPSPMAKITLIGAGSVVFAKNLICDILQNPALIGSTICLMDIDAARLKIAKILADKVVAQLNVPAKIEATMDLKAACSGARYVITMIQVGGYKPGTVTDFEIPKKYGLRQTIADTLGIGGIFRALRTMPELVKVGNMLRDYGAESPLYLNYSNPMAMNMMAIDRVCQIPSVGLCHSVQGTSRQLAGYIGLPYEDISYKVAGINHVAFFLEFKYRGQDAYPLLFKALENPQVFAADKVRFEMMRRLGYFVTESSEHFSEYCPYFIHHGDQVITDFGIPLDEYIRRCESVIATWKETEKRMLDDNKPVAIRKSVEYGSHIINAMESGEPIVVYGNIPNKNLITNIPYDCCVEVPCLVDKQGIQPTHIGALPPQLAALVRTNVSVQELTVQAFLTGEREYIYHAAMMDPHTSSQLTLPQIWAMCDELIEAHQKDGLLGDFKPVRKNTGRSAASLARVIAKIENQTKDSSNPNHFDLELVVENDTDTDFSGTVNLHIDHAKFTLSHSETVSLEVAAGATTRIPLQVERIGNHESILSVGVRGNTPKILGVDFSETRRQHLKAGSGDKAAPIHISWSGNTVAEGKLALDTDTLVLTLRVNDSDIIINSRSFWEASAIELFFNPAGTPTGKPLQLIALPDGDNARIVSPRGAPIPGTSMTTKADKAGYDCEIRLPAAALNTPITKPFLMEIQMRVNALGDAHGRNGQAWQNSHNPHLQSTNFAVIEPVK